MDLTPFKNCLAHTNSIYISNETEPHKPCCWFKQGIAATSVTEYREKLAGLDIESNCSHCITQEKQGATWSHRQLFQNPKEFVLGICFDNICNLKCVTCSPMHSSQLIQEWEQLDLYGPKLRSKHFVRIGKEAPNKLEFIKDVLINTEFDILKIEIFGGEPLINPFVFKFLDWITEQKYANQTWLSITTNTTTYSDKIETYCSKFQNVSIQLSIDGVEETFEYLRYGAKWDKAVHVAQSYYNLLDPYPNFSLSFNYTLSWMNCLNFVNFYNWAIINFPKIHLHLTKLEGPELYPVNHLTYEQREMIVQYTMDNLVQKPNSHAFERLLDLYKQSMLFKTPYQLDKLNDAYALLEKKDSARTMDYKIVLKPLFDFLKI